MFLQVIVRTLFVQGMVCLYRLYWGLCVCTGCSEDCVCTGYSEDCVCVGYTWDSVFVQVILGMVYLYRLYWGNVFVQVMLGTMHASTGHSYTEDGRDGVFV